MRSCRGGSLAPGGWRPSLLCWPGRVAQPPEAQQVYDSHKGRCGSCRQSDGFEGQLRVGGSLAVFTGILGLQSSPQEITHPINMEPFMYLRCSLNFYQETFSKCNMC